MYPYNLRQNYNRQKNNFAFSANPLNIKNNVPENNPIKTLNHDETTNPTPPHCPPNETPPQPPHCPPNETDKPNAPSDNKYILEMIREAIKDEIKDGKYYDELANKVENENDKKALHKIHADEVKHSKMLKEIYHMLTGEYPDISVEAPTVGCDLPQIFSERLYEELDAVEFYRKLMFVFLNLEIRDMLFEILTDEQAHAQIMNYLFSKYN